MHVCYHMAFQKWKIVFRRPFSKPKIIMWDRSWSNATCIIGKSSSVTVRSPKMVMVSLLVHFIPLFQTWQCFLHSWVYNWVISIALYCENIYVMSQFTQIQPLRLPQFLKLFRRYLPQSCERKRSKYIHVQIIKRLNWLLCIVSKFID